MGQFDVTPAVAEHALTCPTGQTKPGLYIPQSYMKKVDCTPADGGGQQDAGCSQFASSVVKAHVKAYVGISVRQYIAGEQANSEYRSLTLYPTVNDSISCAQTPGVEHCSGGVNVVVNGPSTLAAFCGGIVDEDASGWRVADEVELENQGPGTMDMLRNLCTSCA